MNPEDWILGDAPRTFAIDVMITQADEGQIDVHCPVDILAIR
jgi:hypothetical protein